MCMLNERRLQHNLVSNLLCVVEADSKIKKQTYLDDDRVSSKETVKLLDNQSEAASLGGQNLKK